jgi:hypothetical protein
MAKFIRYALATVCFAASVGCLALWWRSYEERDLLLGPFPTQSQCFYFLSQRGSGSVSMFDLPKPVGPVPLKWHHSSEALTAEVTGLNSRQRRNGYFGTTHGRVHFPLWSPALIFALAGVAALRFRRQFSIRSALICVSVVAALLGMMVAL